MKKFAIFACLLAVATLWGCKSSKHLMKETTPEYLSSKVELTLQGNNGGLSVGGTMKMKRHERIQVSLLMPILRTEVARIEMTPTELLLVDRMNKRYMRATREELQAMLPKNVDYARLEKLLTDASQPGGKKELTGKDLGIAKLEKAKVQLYGFSTNEFSISPTELGNRYQQVSPEELIHILTALLQ